MPLQHTKVLFRQSPAAVIPDEQFWPAYTERRLPTVLEACRDNELRVSRASLLWPYKGLWCVFKASGIRQPWPQTIILLGNAVLYSQVNS